jgi:hypothetical protein
VLGGGKWAAGLRIRPKAPGIPFCHFFNSCFDSPTPIYNLNSNLFMGFTQGSSAEIKVLS